MGALLAQTLRAIGARDAGALRHTGRLLLVFALGLVPLVMSPAYYWARYALPTPAVGLVAILAFLSRPRMRSFGEGAIGAMGVLNLVTLYWAVPGWDVSVATAFELARLPPEERVHAQVSQNLLPAEASRRREQRIGRGDVVAFDDRISFLGNLWNEEMSNWVVYVPCRDGLSWAERVEELGAAWAVAGRGGACEQVLRSRGGRWREIARGRRDEVIWERVEETTPRDGGPAPPAREGERAREDESATRRPGIDGAPVPDAPAVQENSHVLEVSTPSLDASGPLAPHLGLRRTFGHDVPQASTYPHSPPADPARPGPPSGGQRGAIRRRGFDR
jgi:hypothetical protein